MAHIIGMDLEDGGTILIEVAQKPARGPRPVAAAEDKAMTKLERKFDEAIDSVRGCANALVKKMTSLVVKPDEVNVKFGLKVNVEGSALVATVGAETHFDISLTWKPQGGGASK